MKPIRYQLLILSALLLALPTICAASPHAGPYVSGFIGVSVPRDNTVTTENFDNTPTNHDKVEFEPGINIGGTGGFDFGYLRLEGEMSFKYSEIESITDQNANFRFRNPDGNLGVAAFMTNAFFDLHNESRVTPYLGGGIGFASLHLSDTRATDAAGRVLLYDEDNDAVFAYQAGAGVEVAINRMFSLDFGYRYFATDTANFDNGFDQATSLKFESHNATVGFRTTF
ncbi:MAG: porin family protein [Steroidobacteraceae bacterium]|nr:porin family protein [Deltaproteobacteria bacterium]